MAGSFSDLSNSLLTAKGQANFTSDAGQGTRNAYPALVVNTNDPAEQNRIVCRIINISDSGDIRGGRDKDTPDNKLPLCFPLVPEYFHVRPLVGEMVLVILENPNDNTAPRYWIGPIINSKLKLRTQSYQEAVKIFDQTDFFINRKTNDKVSASLVFPGQADIALQGRDDADLILRPRETLLSAGKFKPNSFDINDTSPCFIQLKQNIDSNKQEFSQINMNAVNLNLYSPYGKFKKAEENTVENFTDLEKLGEVAKQLHPVMFGDEGIKLLDLMIKVIIAHTHTPQSAPLSFPELDELKSYTINGKLQNLISNYLRIN